MQAPVAGPNCSRSDTRQYKVGIRTDGSRQMSRIFEALQQSNPDITFSPTDGELGAEVCRRVVESGRRAVELDEVSLFTIPVDSTARLVAATEPHSSTANKL